MNELLRMRIVSALILLDAIGTSREITEAELADLRTRLMARAVAGAQ